MAIKDSILPEFDHEMATTRRVLERVPEDKKDWQPHPKSMTLGRLAQHLATIPHWVIPTINDTELHMNPPGGPAYTPPQFESTASALAVFDENVRQGRAAIAAAEDQALMVPWTLRNAGQPIFTLPRVAVLRSFVTNHMIHHRGQLSVYLRLNDVPVPSIYGPSADEMS